MPLRTVMGAFGPNALHEYPVPAHMPRPKARDIRPKDRMVVHPYNILHDAYDLAHTYDVASVYIDQGIQRNGLRHDQLRYLQGAHNQLCIRMFEILYNPKTYFALMKVMRPEFMKALYGDKQKDCSAQKHKGIYCLVS